MLKIGITGGIGSGKTMVCRLFSLLGIPVFNSDMQARILMNEDQGIKTGLISLFGSAALDKEGKPDRKLIADRVFENKEHLDALNALIHPAVFRAFDTWQASLTGTAPYCIKEAAIMFESGSYLQNDFNVTIFSSVNTRIERVQNRDHLAVSEVTNRMNRQMPEDEKMRRSDFVIYNDEQHSLIEQVMDLDIIFRQNVPEQSA